MPDHDHPTDPFDDRVRRALDDAILGASLQTATEPLTRRRATWQELGNPIAAPSGAAPRARRLPDHRLSADDAAANIEARGGHVHFAVSADEAPHRPRHLPSSFDCDRRQVQVDADRGS
ncbi:MAG: hypothetical protein KIS91_01920 [Anaerolineae bacterium]|nr:hypothetical protein [Anaerolineae bacterium]